MRAFPLLAALVALAGAAGAASGDDERVAVGQRVERFELVDTRYLRRSLDELGPREASVVVFTTVECPLAQRYLPRLAALEREMRGRGVRFLGLDVGPTTTLVEVAAFAVEAGAAFPFGKDFDGDAVRALGAERTPEVCVLDAAGVLRYRGRVDGQFRFGGARPSTGREDLREALEDVLAGREVRVPETAVDGCPIPASRAARPGPSPPTWSEHVAPLVQRYCQDCHHDGGSAPFALVEARDVADRADVVAEAVAQQRMPPWFASPDYGSFHEGRLMSARERETIAAWIAAGTPLGDPELAPPPRTFERAEWRIGEPDLVLRSPREVEVPADGYVPYQYTILPYVFTRDTWLARVEIKPQNPRVLHHANLAYVALGESFSQDNFITGQVPGGSAMTLPEGVAVLVPAGSVLALQMHYVTSGERATDRIAVGLSYPREPVRKRLRHEQVQSRRFEIPPGAPAHEVVGRRKLDADSIGIGMFAHMHVRGRDMRFVAKRPGAEDETLLLVPNYNFDWQMAYEWERGAVRFPAGTVLECLAHFDNSPFNPYNPDPAATVRFGLQTYHEMMYGFVFYVHADEELGLRVDPKTGRAVE